MSVGGPPPAVALNAIKYSTISIADTISCGNFLLGVCEVSYAPSETSDFWNTCEIPAGGYAIYMKRPASTEPSIMVPTNDTELLSILNVLGASASTIIEGLSWACENADVLVVNKKYEDIVVCDLIFNFDPGFVAGFPKGDTTIYDLSKNNTNGLLTNGPTYNSTSASGSISFDGDNDFIEYGNIASSDPLSLYGLSEFTINVWVKADGTGDGYQRIIDKSNSGSAAGGWMVIIGGAAANTDSVGLYIDGTSIHLSAGTAFGVWRSYTWTRSGNVTRFYINGTYTNTSTVTKLVPSTTTGCRIGSWNHSTGREFNGDLGTIKIYERALTDAEVLQNFDALVGRI